MNDVNVINDIIWYITFAVHFVVQIFSLCFRIFFFFVTVRNICGNIII